MKQKGKIAGTADAWESGLLGRDIDHAVAAPKELENQIDEALGLQMISIRLSTELIKEFKMIAKFNGVGYQPLMRDALKRFADSELKRIATLYANEKAERERQHELQGQQDKPDQDPPKHKEAA
ncbi:hypothetical protein ACO0K9_12310 [Undibacterium sp. Ji50W]|uniref:hypothetical protein n=1 Tax=Undibacterium sp. Ji50W TaxID=3413041 RepID=UPI003BF30CA4